MEKTPDQLAQSIDDHPGLSHPEIGTPIEEEVESSPEGIPDWLREMGTRELFKPDENDGISESTRLDKEGDSSSIESEIPEWLLSDPLKTDSTNDTPIIEPVSEMDDYELPEWLKGIESEKVTENLKSVDGFDPDLVVGTGELSDKDFPMAVSETETSSIPPIADEPELIISHVEINEPGIDATDVRDENTDFENDREAISEDVPPSLI